MMFSATMPKRIIKIAERHLQDPQRIEIPREVVPEGERPTIAQTAYIVARPYKGCGARTNSRYRNTNGGPGVLPHSCR